MKKVFNPVKVKVLCVTLDTKEVEEMEVVLVKVPSTRRKLEVLLKERLEKNNLVIVDISEVVVCEKVVKEMDDERFFTLANTVHQAFKKVEE